jgi:hypothetical protein
VCWSERQVEVFRAPLRAQIADLDIAFGVGA